MALPPAVTQARTEALIAVQEADEAERKARNLRRKAQQKTHRYENLLAEFNGQLFLDYEELGKTG